MMSDVDFIAKRIMEMLDYIIKQLLTIESLDMTLIFTIEYHY